MDRSKEQIFVRVMRNGFIPQLGMCGPIPYPIKVTRAVCHSMIVSGIEVMQYDPETKITTKLTLQNVFGGETKAEEPKKVEAPKAPEYTKTPETTTFNGIPKPETKVEEPKKVETPVVEEKKVEEPAKAEEVKKEEAPATEAVKEEEKKDSKKKNK